MAVLPNFKHLLQILDELNTNQMVVKKVVIKVNREQFIANYFSKTNKKKLQSLFWDFLAKILPNTKFAYPNNCLLKQLQNPQ